MRIVLLGEAGAGKTSTFCAVSQQPYDPSALYADSRRAGEGRSCVAVVEVLDPRLPALNQVHGPLKLVYPQLTLVDLPPLPLGAEETPPEAAEVLAAAREADGLLAVVGMYQEAGEATEVSRCLRRGHRRLLERFRKSDEEAIERRLEKLQAQLRRPRPERELDIEEREVLQQFRERLGRGEPLPSSLTSNQQVDKRLRSFGFLSQKPLALLLNLPESAVEQVYAREPAKEESWPLHLALCSSLECELTQLEDQEEQRAFMAEYGLPKLRAPELPALCLKLLQLVTFFTIGEEELRGWCVPETTPMPEAAGKIHTDMKRGFIAAEVLAFRDWEQCDGSFKKARATGRLRVEGKGCEVRDGDIIKFRFNV